MNHGFDVKSFGCLEKRYIIQGMESICYLVATPDTPGVFTPEGCRVVSEHHELIPSVWARLFLIAVLQRRDGLNAQRRSLITSWKLKTVSIPLISTYLILH